jgi:Zn-dependent peptidase ImmA (M78 family)/DNA-binding XRE family transcriptional regulator
MPSGTEGFVPRRLTMAREARALKKRDLARLLDRSESAVSQWESESKPKRPEPSLLPQLAGSLSVGISWFWRPLRFKDESAVFYRSMVTELEALRKKARGRLGFLQAIEEAVSEHVQFPDTDLPEFLEGRDFKEFRMEDIEYCARELREHWGVQEGPIDDLLLLIENAGIIVGEDDIGSLKLDGVSRWPVDAIRPYMLLARDKKAGVRRRLDAAHELGHLVLHRNLSQKDLDDNFDLIEDQAMEFAGAFLLPAREFPEDVYSLTLEALISIKEKWLVSVGAMIKRLVALRMIRSDYERRLWQYYSFRKWRGREPLDDRLPIEAPHNLRDGLETAIDERVCTRAELLHEIGLLSEDICGLTGLPENFFDPEPENVVRLRPRVRGTK